MKFPILDGHNDLLLHLYRRDPTARSFFTRLDEGHLDLERARAGGFAGGFFAVFVPIHPDDPDEGGMIVHDDGSFEFPLANALELGYSQRIALELMAVLYRLERESKGEVRIVGTALELESAVTDRVIAAILHFEGAEPIDPGLNSLETYYRSGLRSLGIVWSRPNAFAEGVHFAFPHSPETGPGLTDAGCALVRACNELGIIVDVSHLNAEGFRDVVRISHAPIVATHSNAHALCRSTRNLMDWQLDAIRDSDGVVGLNFGVCFLREDGGDESDVPVERMVRHIEYMVERMGARHVAFGSDFDGVTIPDAICDVAGLPLLVEALREHGFNEDELALITHRNWMRVAAETWR